MAIPDLKGPHESDGRTCARVTKTLKSGSSLEHPDAELAQALDGCDRGCEVSRCPGDEDEAVFQLRHGAMLKSNEYPCPSPVALWHSGLLSSSDALFERQVQRVQRG